MGYNLKHADVLSAGLLLTFRDGREALLEDAEVLDCAVKCGAFERVKVLQIEDEEAQADNGTLVLDEGDPE